ncbi:TIGR03560 family F420-dependent LLM class oxidoreductase [Natronosporangium hydrolyticum]|uniref:TIGR03560 family F420-dependent LLM class oxidoreductase n=1 Tax=Natronosporangium hydrolyticum TaxID=2811111 RepID=A0A895YDI1_9ACTN|nr:TIGR03560 family F420-dependent LLM class oxidoreductase [Natronosporangium hydrolyticum]QSB15864.1 TIGR03560 family F420-dependent LLM class oxidoreductase [Natronosporangium hydrolyticum]
MEVCLFIEPHRGASYREQRDFARHAEECGFAGLFRADHYQPFGSSAGLPGPTDAWLTLAALAVETIRIRLGTLVTSITFRLPGPLAIAVAQVDQMSQGRVELGIGAGWFAPEHRSYGIPFPPLAERLSRLAEQLEVVTGLWRTPVGERFGHQGRYYQLVDAPALPKPVQVPGPPIIIGGRGLRRTPMLAARYADEFNATFQAPAAAASAFRAVAGAAAQVGRRRPIRRSVGIPVACGRTDAQARQRAAALYEPGSVLPAGESLVVGSPQQLVDRIHELREVGADRVYLRPGALTDRAHLDLLASEVLPAVTTC